MQQKKKEKKKIIKKRKDKALQGDRPAFSRHQGFLFERKQEVRSKYKLRVLCSPSSLIKSMASSFSVGAGTLIYTNLQIVSIILF